MRELPAIRREINEVDEQMRALFLKRMSLALEVAHAKAETNDSVYKPDREAEIIEQRTAGMDGEIRLKYTALLQSMIRASREYQYSEQLREEPARFPLHPAGSALDPKTVYYQGVPGAYQELAARALFPQCEPVNVPTWEQVFRSVRDGAADVGVVPVENTTAGTVSEVYDLLLEYGLCINRSYIRKISHCLAAVPGARLADIQSVCSHPHALPQCHAFIAAHNLEAIEVANTAIAALMTMLNEFYDKGVNKAEYMTFLTLLNPFAPHITEELWQQMGGKGLLSIAPWPQYDEAKTVEDTVEMAVQVNGKLKCTIKLPVDCDKQAAIDAALAEEKVQHAVEGKQMVKQIVVPGKIVNLVVR